MLSLGRTELDSIPGWLVHPYNAVRSTVSSPPLDAGQNLGFLCRAVSCGGDDVQESPVDTKSLLNPGR